ncbi:unnamed protein product [Spirodela intermedia]|uniref:Beta-hexosaminidase n=1 Tax=Spirodela intermedia TaxID=51605 RepID=A0A7I8IQ04_SPIIN|nr:unnamed protein product [Spirodela intermedia]CAA6659081.1 unnamed protein product [Spirodela intermedia]
MGGAIVVPSLFILLISSLLALGYGGAAAAAAASPPIGVWPKPVHTFWPQPDAAFLTPSFRILSSGTTRHRHLRRAVARYTRLVLRERHGPLVARSPEPSPRNPPLRALVIRIADLSVPLQHGVDESYALCIPPAGAGAAARLAAATPWGPCGGWRRSPSWSGGIPRRTRGDQHLRRADFPPPRAAARHLPELLPCAGHTAHGRRHGRQQAQFVPLLLPSEPQLALKGSYGKEMIYSPADVKRIVDFAASRGVRVIPEFDSPEAYPGIVTCANEFWLPPGLSWADRLASEPGPGQLNPLNPETYRVVGNVLRDAAELFPEPFLHLGADEVVPGCWRAEPAVRDFLAFGGTFDQLLEIFVNATNRLAVSLNRTVVFWEDVLLDAAVKVRPEVLPRETTIIQTWSKGPNNTKLIAAAGYRVIVSSSEFYYLDCGHGGFVGNDSRYDRQVADDPATGPFNFAGGDGGSWCAPFKTWQRVYDYDITYGLSAEEARLVLGGRWRCGRSRRTRACWTRGCGRGRRRWRRRCGRGTGRRAPPAGRGTRRPPTGCTSGATAWWRGASVLSPSSPSGASTTRRCATWFSSAAPKWVIHPP